MVVEKQSIISGATQGNPVKSKGGGIIRPFFFSTSNADVCSSNSSSVQCLHLQIGGNNQQSSHSGALILSRLSIAALPSAARGCLGLERLIGSDVLSFLPKLIRCRRAPLSKIFLCRIIRSPVQWYFWERRWKDSLFPNPRWSRLGWTCCRSCALAPVKWS